MLPVKVDQAPHHFENSCIADITGLTSEHKGLLKTLVLCF